MKWRRRELPQSLARVADHQHRYFEGHPARELRETPGPVQQRVPYFRVHEFAPGPRHDGWTYATVGLWEAVHDEAGHGIELLLTAPTRDGRMVERLAMTAYYHAGKPSQRFDLGHTVPIGEPWLPGSLCDHFVLSLPYMHGSDLEWCEWNEGHARHLWLLPITAAEKNLAVSSGIEALEQALEDAGVIPTDVDRPSVA